MYKGDWIEARKRRQKIDKATETLKDMSFYILITMVVCIAVLYVYMQIS